MQIIGIVYPLATCLVSLVGREAMMSNRHLEQDMLTRYVVANFLGSGSPKRTADLETFTRIWKIYFLINTSWRMRVLYR